MSITYHEDEMRVYMAQLNPQIGAMEANGSKIELCIDEARKSGCDLIICPELAICGYIPDDLLLEKPFIDNIERQIERLIPKTKGITLVVGTVRRCFGGKQLKNSAAVISDGKLLGFQDKSLLPTYDVFDEWRYFEPAESQHVWDIAGMRCGITICEDLWPIQDPFCRNRYPYNPLQYFEQHSIDLLINISASPYSLGKIEIRQQMVKQAALLLQVPSVLVNRVGSQDGVLFDGSSLVVSRGGALLRQGASFSEECFTYDIEQKSTFTERKLQTGEELFSALSMGVKDYFAKQGFTKACLGLSGGVDSSVVACIAVDALGKDNVLGVLLPSRFTSSSSREDALTLASNLGIATCEIPIEEPLHTFLDVLSPVLGTENLGVTQENLQSRIRGNLLMAISNAKGCLLLNTGNKSELAVGYTTLYGDSCGAIAVLGDLLKRQVYEIAAWINTWKEIIPDSVRSKAPTAELRFDQKDSDTLPEYPILDAIVDGYVVLKKTVEDIAKDNGLELSLVNEIIAKIHANEYKRRQAPFALRVSEKAFSVGRRVPIVHRPINLGL